MASGSKEKKKFKEKLKDTYRILVIDVEDLKEVGNYQFSMARLYTYILSIVLIFFNLINITNCFYSTKAIDARLWRY